MTGPLRTGEPIAGQSVTRVDGRLKVTGAARYAADHPTQRVLHAVLVCSTVARGSVAGIDADVAGRHPGVLRVISDFAGVKLPYDPREVSTFGQPVAVVVAETLEAASHGASVVRVRYDRTTSAVTNIDAPEAIPQPGIRVKDYSRGDADKHLQNATVVTDLSFSIHRNNHNPIELFASIADWTGDELTVWDKVQGTSESQKNYADAFGLPVDRVRVISQFVGGAFGSAYTTWPGQLLGAFAARQMRRPVKLALTRRQQYSLVGYRPTSRQRLAIGADRTGRINAIIHEGRTENSRSDGYEDSIIGPPRSLYTAPNMRSTYRVVPLDINPPTYMRGPGMTTGAFALESAMDDLAFQLGKDPIELRRLNEPDHDQEDDLPFSSRRLTECFAEGARRFGWSQRNPIPRSVRDGHQLVGIGTAAATYHTSRRGCSVRARINADGTAVVESATIDMGPGTYTSMTQVAADALGLPLRRVTFALGDSRMPKAPAQAGSATMASVGSAVQNTGALLRDKMIRTAVTDPGSPLHGFNPEEVVVVNGQMLGRTDASRIESYQDLIRRRGWDHVESQHDWEPDDAITRYSMNAYGAVFAEVAVDELLGTVRVRRIFGCYDAGRVINPKLAHSQAIGGMVGGIGMALLEATDLDHRDGRIVNANMSDYLVPVNADVPTLDATFLPAEDTLANPIGVKGLAEVVMVGVPAAIANAVFNATGRRIRDLPVTLDKLL